MNRFFLSIVCCLMMGCGGASDAPEGLVPASGNVTYKGSALTTGSITFKPVGEGNSVSANIGSDGNFELMFSPSASGAKPGEYLVGVIATEGEATMDEEGNPVDPKEIVPAEFNDPTTSGLKASIPDGGSSSLNIEIK